MAIDKDIASLGISVDSSRGVSSLEALKRSTDGAATSAEKLEEVVESTTKAISEVSGAASEAARGVSAFDAASKALAETEEQAAARIKEMVSASLEAQAAARAAANEARRAGSGVFFTGFGVPTRGDPLRRSVEDFNTEFAAINDAMAQQAQSLEEIAHRREWINDALSRHVILASDAKEYLERLEKQEREVTRRIEEHAEAVQRLLREYDPASAALRKIAEDEARLNDALKVGAITREQHARAVAGLQVNRARWEAEAKGVQQLASQLQSLSLTSGTALRTYMSMASAIARGDFETAARQASVLSLRAGGLQAILSPLGVTLGIVGTAAGTMALAFARGQAETYELHKAIILTGNAAGVTAEQIGRMAREIARMGPTRGEATRALGLAIAGGRIGAEQLPDVARLAIELQKLGGPAMEETIRLFNELGERPVQAAERLQRQYNFLTAEVLDLIRALEREGRTAEAAAFAQNELAATLDTRLTELRGHLGILPTLWNNVASAAKNAWDAMLNIGRPESIDEQVQRLQRELNLIRGSSPFVLGSLGLPIDPSAHERRLRELDQQIAEREIAAIEAAQQADEFRRAQTERALDQIRAAAASQTASAQLQANIADIDRALNASLTEFREYERTLSAQRAAHLIDEKTWYAERLRLIEADREARVQALRDQNALLQAERARLQQATEEAIRRTDNPLEAERARTALQAQLIANQEKIKANDAEIARINSEALTNTRLLHVEQQGAVAALATSYENARRAAQDYLDVIERRRQRELEDIGAGPRQREINARLFEIEERFAAQRREVENERARLQAEGRLTDIARQHLDQRLELLREYEQKELESERDHFRKLEEARGSFYNGAIEALRTYADESRNVASQVADAFKRGFDDATDRLVKFVMTGKGNFSDLIDSIIADLLRLQLQQSITTVLNWLFPGLVPNAGGGGSIFGGLFGGLFGRGGNRGTAGNNIVEGEWDWWDQIFGRSFGWPRFATGTPFVDRTGPAIVHEGEAIIPASMNPFAGGRGVMGGVTIVNYNTFGPGSNVAELSAELDRRDAAVKADVIEYLARERNTHPLSRKF